MCVTLPLTVVEKAVPFPTESWSRPYFPPTPKSTTKMNLDTEMFMCKIRRFWDLF